MDTLTRKYVHITACFVIKATKIHNTNQQVGTLSITYTLWLHHAIESVVDSDSLATSIVITTVYGMKTLHLELSDIFLLRSCIHYIPASNNDHFG